MVAISAMEDFTFLHHFVFLSTPMVSVNNLETLVANKGCNKTLLPSTLLRTNWLDTYREIHIKVKGKVFPLQARLWPRGWVQV